MRIHATLALLLAVAAPASAGGPAGKPAALIGATQAARIAPDRGFVDDPIAADDARLAYVNTDGATFADLVVFELAGARELVRAPLPAELGTPASLRWIGAADKRRLFVVGRTEDGVAHAATFELSGRSRHSSFTALSASGQRMWPLRPMMSLTTNAPSSCSAAFTCSKRNSSRVTWCRDWFAMIPS